MKTYIIAEAGTGHMAVLPDDRAKIAKRFIREARRAGADAVKFQMFVPDEPLFCPLPGDEKRTERWRKTALPFVEWLRLQAYAKSIDIDLLWSVFQPTCIEWLKELKPRYVKVASRAAASFPYDTLDGPFIISTGMGEPTTDQGYWLQCCAEYPAPLKFWEKHQGLSDHSGTPWPAIDAIVRGAKFLEVHFKIPGADMGNDEPVCLTTDQLKLLCEARDAFARMHQN